MKKPRQKKNKQNRQTKITTLVKPKLLTLAIAQALAFQAAQAATIEVTSHLDNGTDCTLREAVTSVNLLVLEPDCEITGGTFGTDDEITFAPSMAGSTITLTNNQIQIASSMSINPGGDEITIDGGGNSRIFSVFGPSVSINQLVLTGGKSDTGAAISTSSSTVAISNSTVTNNSGTDGSGGIFAEGSSVIELTNTTVSSNQGRFGGGIGLASSAVANLNMSTVSNNTSDTLGGGIWASTSSSVDLVNSTISANTATADGGGIAALQDVVVTLIGSTVSDNTVMNDGTVLNDGGGIFAADSTVLLTNSTVSSNTANFGGGIFAKAYNGDVSSVTLTNSTISDNSATAQGGGIFVSSYFGTSSLTLLNSIIANSFGSGDDCNYSFASVTAGANSIIEADGCGTSASNIDPGLMPLADNGGPTETHALMPGSPAIDGGDNATCETHDQRGESRDDGACDIGAYEFKATVMPIATVMTIAKKDRKMGNLMSGGEQWYSFDSTESQKLSMQTNGFSGDTILDFYTGSDPKTASSLKMDDDSGPQRFSNIKQEIVSGPHLIRVKSKTNIDPYWLRLMSDEDILSFNDTASHFANKEIRVMSSAGITGGCGTNKYCPTDPVTRAQMAIFMLKAILGGNHSSPPASGSVFNDVSTSSFGASFIEEFSTLGITSGCGGGKYCPDLAVTREQMAVFLLRAWYGSSYTPPAATPAEINQFSDIANSFAKDWIVQLTKENITGGCGGGKFCPTDTVTRGQMAAFIARTFSLDTEL